MKREPGSGEGAREAVTLSVQLMDPDRVESHPAGLDPVFGDYMRTFMGSPAGSAADGQEGRVFLQRQARRAGVAAGGGGGGAGGEEALMRLLGDVCVANGLECKISCASSKVSYVLDTEDVMWRPGARKFAAAGAGARGRCPVARHAERYAAWLAGREEALRGGFKPYVANFPEAMAQG